LILINKLILFLDVWHEHNNQKLLPGDRTTAQLGSLRPAQVYHIRLFAENHLGTSAPSDVLFVQTDSEVPSAPPQDVTSEPLGPQQVSRNDKQNYLHTAFLKSS